jgi:hypothetical protein
MPVCVTRSCGDPPNIDNGFAVVRGTAVGDTISYSCQTGHRLSGTQIQFNSIILILSCRNNLTLFQFYDV